MSVDYVQEPGHASPDERFARDAAMSATKHRLLLAACDAAGGAGPLAQALGLSEAMLRKYMSGAFPLPDPLLLRAVDFILEERESQLTHSAKGAASSDKRRPGEP